MPRLSHVATRFALLAVASVLLLADAKAKSIHDSPPGKFDYYVLSLGWLPSYCAHQGHHNRHRHCGTDNLDRFVLHGLWPEFEKGWPTHCDIGKKPWVEEDLIKQMSDIIPSKRLVIHEYRTHGTCSGLTPEDYFALARKLYDRIEVPPAFVEPQKSRRMSPSEVESAFLAANDWLTPDAVSVSCKRHRLSNIRICFDRQLNPRACGVNEDQKRECPLDEISVPVP